MKIPARTGLRMAAAFLLTTAAFIAACKHEPAPGIGISDGGYPPEVNRILITHCMTGVAGGGCHNASGAPLANGLRLDTWDHLFDGGNHGAAVIAYDTVNSTLLHYVNTDSSNGRAIALPQMPYTGTNYTTTPISISEYKTLRDWIAAGAPDKNGVIPFANSGQKIYVTEQGNDVLSVVDAARHVIMRNIPIGKTNLNEGPHAVRVSNDGNYAYVSFLNGDWLQKIDTKTDRVAGELQLSNGESSWNMVHVSDDGTMLIAADFLTGRLVIVNTATMQVIPGGNILSGISSPHGMIATPDFDTIYIAAEYGNSVYKLIRSKGLYRIISIDGNPPNVSAGQRDPHEIYFTPTRDKYFLTCEASNEVRVLNTATDTVMAAIPVPTKPQELAVSKTHPYMFASCMEASSPTPGASGAIVVINYETLQVVKTIWGPFWEPHGVTVDDASGEFYVASTNQTGPSVGHNHDAAGKHGWINIYDLNTLELKTTRQYEMLVLPYAVDARYK